MDGIKQTLLYFVPLLLVLLLGQYIIFGDSVSASQSKGEVYKVNHSYLNIRSGPGASYEQTGRLEAGEAVTVYEIREGNWGQIWHDGQINWICMDYLVKPDSAGSSGEASKQQESSSTEKVIPQSGSYCYDYQITNSFVNVRTGPGTEYEKVGELHKNDIVCVYEIRGDWGRFKINGENVWFLLDYANCINTTPMDVSTTSGESSGSSQTARPTVTEYEKGIIYKVTNDYVNVRSGASTAYPMLGRIVSGDEVTVYAVSSDNWGRFDYDGQEAWFYLNYAQKVDSTARQEAKEADSTAINMESTGSEEATAAYTGWHDASGGWEYYDKSGQMLFSSDSMHAAWTKIRNQSSKTDYYIVTDTRACETYVFQGSSGNWKPCYLWSCAPGAPMTPTRKGHFTITARGYSFGSSSYSCYYYTQFSGNYLYHSILYKKGTFEELDARLGQQVSHGCVRLPLESAKWLYDHIPTDTKVYVY